MDTVDRTGLPIDSQSGGQLPRQQLPGERPLARFSDRELLAAYCAKRSSDALAEIVIRHGAMVYRTCRRLVSNEHDAEDATQAVFLLLAQRPQVAARVLGGWLHEVARTMALKILRDRARRLRREEIVARMKIAPDNQAGNELREELDAALARLPSALREAVVLRYLEGRDQEEAARIAGCPRGTLSWRATEGLNRLRSLLERRGLVVAPAMIMGLFAQEAVADMPAKLLALPNLIAAGALASGSPTALLASGMARTLFWAKAKMYALVVASCLAGVGGPLAAWQILSSRPDTFVPASGKDIGTPRMPDRLNVSMVSRVPGSFTSAGRTFTVKSAALDIWGPNDSLYFVHQPLLGDGAICAKLISLEKTGAYVKAGVMIRESLDPGARNAFLTLVANEKLCFQVRSTPSVDTICPYATDRRLPSWLKVVRQGNNFSGFVSQDGVHYSSAGSHTVNMNAQSYIGLAVTSHKDGEVTTSIFDHVTVSTGP